MINKLDYKTFVTDNKELLKEFRDKRVLVSYAGGKDASVILHFLIQAKKEFGFEFETHAAMFPSMYIRRMKYTDLIHIGKREVFT